MKRTVWVSAVLLAAALGVGVWWGYRATGGGEEPGADDSVTASVKAGARLFAVHCQTCHGREATGTGIGPPLVHVYYEPNHHPDQTFQAAVRNGVRQHHWRFGDMPPVPGLSPDDVEKITAYVRALQRAEGIF